MKWETVTLLTQQAHHSAQLYLQQLPWRVAKYHVYTIYQAGFSTKFSTVNWWLKTKFLKETFLTPSDNLFHIIHWEKNVGQLKLFVNNTLHRNSCMKMDSTTSTFSSVNPQAIFIHTTTCCVLEKCQLLLPDYWDDPQTSCRTSINLTNHADWHADQSKEGSGVGGGLCDGLWLFVHLQSISERVLSALACLLVERMVCLTAEMGWNKDRERLIKRKGNRFCL